MRPLFLVPAAALVLFVPVRPAVAADEKQARFEYAELTYTRASVAGPAPPGGRRSRPLSG